MVQLIYGALSVIAGGKANLTRGGATGGCALGRLVEPRKGNGAKVLEQVAQVLVL